MNAQRLRTIRTTPHHPFRLGALARTALLWGDTIMWGD